MKPPRRPLRPALALLLLAACNASGEPPAGAPSVPRPAPPAEKGPTADDARLFVEETDAELRRLWTQAARAAWVNQTHITDDTDALAAAAEEASMEYLSSRIKAATRFDKVELPEDVRRQLTLLKISSQLPAPAAPKERAELAQTVVQMQSAYGKGKYCGEDGKGKCRTLGELSKTLAESRSYDELLDAWRGWHRVGKGLRDKFTRYVELGNKGAREIGYADLGALWRSGYDMSPEAFEAETERLWKEVKPLYDELHCYVRAKLAARYGKDKVPEKGPIPAHLLGNMWAQDWSQIYDMLEPYPGQASLDVTSRIRAKNLDEKAMVKLGENFFVSLGLDPLPKTFWERSMFKKPADREVVCHASAWDLTYAGDIRIKMCVEKTEEDLITIHHELGHDYYYQYYHKLPVLFQTGANDGFHEGIGDTLALSVTPAYLASIGLLGGAPANEKAEVNVLLKSALSKIAFLPFGKLIDQWRWDVFAGKIPKSDYNASYWKLREKYQGVAPAPAAARTEADFDPGAKYHVPANVPYTRYFLAHIYQFQFHRALCKAAGHEGPLHKCSIHGSKAAGDKLRAMLALGASKPWPEAMKVLTGDDKADPSALLEFYAPLRKFLKEKNEGKACGW